MGLLDKIKGWLNIGGVKVALEGVNPMVSKSGSQITGRAVLTSKSDKQVLSVTYKFVLEKTEGKGEEKEIKEFVLGKSALNEPFDIQAGETKELEFSIAYSIEKTLQDMGGVLGAIGKLGALAAAEKLDYFIIAEADVKGTPFDPAAKMAVQIID